MHHLKSGNTKSCGCLKSEKCAQRNHDFCEDNNINLLRIPYTDYGKLNKNDDYLMRKINEATS